MSNVGRRELQAMRGDVVRRGAGLGGALALAAVGLAMVASSVLVTSSALAQPTITRPVTDEASVLSPLATSALEDRLHRHYDSGHAQIAVLIVRTTGGVPIADYANVAASLWGGGSASDDGVLFVLAVDDREMRIEVGYGLEDRIPDRVAMQILDDIVEPLRRADYDAAVADVVTALIARTGAVTSTPASELPRVEETEEDGSSVSAILTGIVVVVALVLAVGLLVVFLMWKDGNLASYQSEGFAGGWARRAGDGGASSPAWSPSRSHQPSSFHRDRPKPSSRSHSSSSWGSSKPSSSHKPSSSSSHKPSSSSKSYSGGGGKFGGGGASKRW